MMLAGLAMLLLALAAIGMVLATAGLDGAREDTRETGDADRGPVAGEDHHGFPGRDAEDPQHERLLVLH